MTSQRADLHVISMLKSRVNNKREIRDWRSKGILHDIGPLKHFARQLPQPTRLKFRPFECLKCRHSDSNLRPLVSKGAAAGLAVISGRITDS